MTSKFSMTFEVLALKYGSLIRMYIVIYMHYNIIYILYSIV
jgi:hypothetical protein